MLDIGYSPRLSAPRADNKNINMIIKDYINIKTKAVPGRNSVTLKVTPKSSYIGYPLGKAKRGFKTSK